MLDPASNILFLLLLEKKAGMLYMDDDIRQLRKTLTGGITPERLKEMSAMIIAAFRGKRHELIEQYAHSAGIDSKDGSSRAFSLLMHLYHPDKHAAILRQIDSFAEAGDAGSLRGMVSIYLSAAPAEAASSYEPVSETGEYKKKDFSYSEDWSFEAERGEEESPDDEADEEDEDAGEEINFTEAVNLHFYGNLDEAVTISDMKSLDGELDLSDSGIASLRGAEHCPMLASLNLSGNEIRTLSPLAGCSLLETLYLSENRIESIAPLAALTSLRELDISFNLIDDVSVLLTLDRLEYVNIMGNPLHGSAVAAMLRERGVIVIE